MALRFLPLVATVLLAGCTATIVGKVNVAVPTAHVSPGVAASPRPSTTAIPTQAPPPSASPSPVASVSLAGSWDAVDAVQQGFANRPCIANGFVLGTGTTPTFTRLTTEVHGGVAPMPTPTPSPLPSPTPTPTPPPPTVTSLNDGHLVVTTSDGEHFDLTYDPAKDTWTGTRTGPALAGSPAPSPQPVVYKRQPGAAGNCEVLAP